MNTAVIVFWVVFCLLEMSHDRYQELKNSKMWHIMSWLQALSVAVFLGLMAYTGEPITIRWYLLVLVMALTRWVVMDNLLNLVRGQNLFEVGTTGYMDRKTRWLASKIGMHHELLALILKLILVVIIILLWKLLKSTTV